MDQFMKDVNRYCDRAIGGVDVETPQSVRSDLSHVARRERLVDQPIDLRARVPLRGGEPVFTNLGVEDKPIGECQGVELVSQKTGDQGSGDLACSSPATASGLCPSFTPLNQPERLVWLEAWSWVFAGPLFLGVPAFVRLAWTFQRHPWPLGPGRDHDRVQFDLKTSRC